jgi:L-ascorbate metabolism protein UlaG (beta-lactamase superfamily)
LTVRLSRRAWLVGGAAVLAAMETASLRGTFDHRSLRPVSGRDRYRAAAASLDADAVVHVGHSTHLLHVARTRLLTDPWFYDPAFGALRHSPSPAVAPEEIGPLDAILVTHDHADHADLRAMDRLDKHAVVLVATRELAAKVRARGFSDVAVLAPWEERTVGGARVVAVPGLHDIYEIGFVVIGPTHRVYFAGDTRLHPDLPAIRERLSPDVALLPVDGTRLTGGSLHVMTPDDAASAARTLGCAMVMPTHADAEFTDPLAEHVLASTVAHAAERFRDAIATRLPAVRAPLPLPGERVLL